MLKEPLREAQDEVSGKTNRRYSGKRSSDLGKMCPARPLIRSTLGGLKQRLEVGMSGRGGGSVGGGRKGEG